MTGDLDIKDDVEILGDENAAVTIVGDGTDRVIQTSDSVVVISGVTLTGGAGCCGGGVYAAGGKLTLVNSVIQNCAVSGDGGAILIAISDVDLINTAIHGNTAARFGGGGGIYTLALHWRLTELSGGAAIQGETAT